MGLKMCTVSVVSILLLLSGLAIGEFSIIPTMQLKSIGENAIFRCRHPNASNVRWSIDGEVVRGRNFPSGITPGTERDENQLLVQTLTIVAGPLYNGTKIICVATFDDGSPDEMTPPVILEGIIAWVTNCWLL